MRSAIVLVFLFGCSPNTPSSGWFHLFVTSTTYPGDFGRFGGLSGLAAADLLCDTIAESASLGGRYKAWLADRDNNAGDRIEGTGPWVSPGGQRVFDNHAGFITAPAVPIVWDERSRELRDQNDVWTGARVGGQPDAENCSNWTSAASGVRGRTGARWDPASWTDYLLEDCAKPGHLYCFEQ